MRSITGSSRSCSWMLTSASTPWTPPPAAPRAGDLGRLRQERAASWPACSPPASRRLPFGESPGLYPLKYAATGFLRIRAEVLRPMIHELALPLCDLRWGSGEWPFFQPVIVPDPAGYHYLGEDWAFSYRLGQIGVTPLADTSIRRGTTGTSVRLGRCRHQAPALPLLHDPTLNHPHGPDRAARSPATRPGGRQKSEKRDIPSPLWSAHSHQSRVIP